MSSPFEQIYRFFGLDPCREFASNESLFRGLAEKKTEAIQCLLLKARRPVAYVVRKIGLPETFADDVLHESVVILLKKIESGGYRFEGHAPATFLVEIARRVALNFSRKPSFRPFEKLENAPPENGGEENQHLENLENLDRLEQLLSGLESPCREIISLYYLDELSDQEVVSKQLVGISTVGSLKARRSQCLKKLREMASTVLT